jgi:predicted DNA-binding transcriptional regulator AlpA
MVGSELVDHAGLRALGIRFCRYHIIQRMEPKGEFPISFQLGIHRNSPRVWKLAEVLEWIEQQRTK